MTTIRFDAAAATADGQTTPITVDGCTVELGRGESASAGAWRVEIDPAGHATLSGSSATFQNNYGDGAAPTNVVQLGDVTELRLG